MPIQAKLVVGRSDDHYEREADTVASQVTAFLSGGAAALARRDINPSGRTRISRMSSTVGPDGGDLDTTTEREINAARSGGRPLGGKIRRNMEHAIGADFSGVRMHVGAKSDELNERVQAKAFTTGSDIFVRRADYAPDTAAGQTLLAHELAHTVQQGASPQLPTSTRDASGEDGADAV